MNSSNSRKQMSTPIKNAPPSLTHQYSNLRSDSKSKLPTLVPQGSTSNSPFGQPVEILPSNLFYLFLLMIDKLYWVSDVKPPQNYASSFFFCIDNVRDRIIAQNTHHIGPVIHAIQLRLRSSQSCNGTSIHKGAC
jgi:hypothetical protein